MHMHMHMRFLIVQQSTNIITESWELQKTKPPLLQYTYLNKWSPGAGHSQSLGNCPRSMSYGLFSPHACCQTCCHRAKSARITRAIATAACVRTWATSRAEHFCGVFRPRSIIRDVTCVTSRTRPSPFSACNIENVGVARGRG